ncbi:uncharacterized protein HD556DRAFT_723787 [Suillus plorans]|uniref:Uncharacterized protein n=1 Tax=Suillus plorans TaxID=116603 RepID=A0A9P7DU03_9AGAM|nr:uncharacterized protein HD556DRAFT_723787 [Suillus plorans]KAG1802961.1 hypothetical protein HD556DRAFT_723787 [Suillus plorans]
MNGDEKEVLQLQTECDDFGSAQTATTNSQNCESQFVQRPRQSITARLFGIGLMSLLLFAVFTHPEFNIVRSVSDYYEFSTGLNEPGYPDPSDGAVVRCIGSTEWDEYYELPSWAQQFPFGSESLFTLPVGSDSLYLISRGAFHYGTLTVEQSTEASDDVIVRIRAAYFKEEVFERTNICYLKRQENQNGIGIYTSKSRLPGQDDKDQLMFDVTLTLPASASEDALYIKSLETSAPLFRHEVAALSDTVFFGSISLNTLHFPINVQSVAAETGIFTTANGLIKGHFYSTSSLKLITTNMAIDADVVLFHNESGKPSELVIATANAPLNARVSLTTASGYGGEFGVDAQTANAPFTLTYVNSTVYSQLNSKSKTANAPATVHLHSAFEGSFSISSSIIGPSLEQHRVEDPAGKGRERHVTASRSWGHIQGSVRWAEAEHSRSGTGFVQLSTALSPARLIL